MKAKREIEYSKELAEEICNVIASSSAGLKKLCEEHGHFPRPETILQWRETNKEFSEQYMKAKEFQAEVLVDEILEIIYDNSIDLQRAKIMVDARKWLASKLCPHIYGDRPVDKKGSDSYSLLAQLFREYEEAEEKQQS